MAQAGEGRGEAATGQGDDEATALELLREPSLDVREGEEPSAWEEYFEAQINTFFDEAIARVPGFVDRNLKSFRKVMGRNLSPRTGVADLFIGVRNVAATASKVVGGPDFSTSTYTHDRLTESFEREVVSPAELESLLRRLFTEFEDEQWVKLARSAAEEEESAAESEEEEELIAVRDRLVQLMEREIGHDPALAQAIRAGVKFGIPATLGYVLFGKASLWGGLGQEAAGKVYETRLDFYHRLLHKLGRFEIPGWVGAVGVAGSLLGTLAVGGLMEFAVNNVRDLKGVYIRQLNAARYNLLYGEDPGTPEGQGLMHVVRGLERQFERLAQVEPRELIEAAEELSEALIDEVAEGEEVEEGA